MVQGMTIDQNVLDEIVRRVVEVAHPTRIILFGSAARARWDRTAILIFWSSRPRRASRATGTTLVDGAALFHLL
jgi:hypothetical protein